MTLALDVQTACIWEATARKAGNVHRFADFDDLTYLDFVMSAAAIAPVLERDRDRSIGTTAIQAIRATRRVVKSNTNLGIVLLLAPLTKCVCKRSHLLPWRDQLIALLDASTIDDARQIYEAIRLAVPGGLGKVEDQDVAGEPTQTLREVMALAADRDSIARQYANGFADVLDEGAPALLSGWNWHGSVEAAILTCQLHWLSRFPDSLIARKRGLAEAEAVTRQAQAINLASAEGCDRFREFDRWLRSNSLNPGTTADLVTACLFVALRLGKMDATMPFTWKQYEC